MRPGISNSRKRHLGGVGREGWWFLEAVGSGAMEESESSRGLGVWMDTATPQGIRPQTLSSCLRSPCRGLPMGHADEKPKGTGAQVRESLEVRLGVPELGREGWSMGVRAHEDWSHGGGGCGGKNIFIPSLADEYFFF